MSAVMATQAPDLTGPGLSLSPSLSFEDWQGVGEQLMAVEQYAKTLLRWQLGDWLNFGESRYGESYAQAIEATGLSYSSINNCKQIAQKFEFNRRRLNVPWGHHAELQGLPKADQDAMLDKADSEGWSQKDTREAVGAARRAARDEARTKRREEIAAELPKTEARATFAPNALLGSCLDLLPQVADGSVSLALIDPPYNMDKAEWDSYGSGREFADWCEAWLSEVQRTLADDGALYVFGINRMLSHLQHRLDDMGMQFRSWITWDTIQGAGGGLWVNRSESILYYSKGAHPFEDADAVKLERHEENVREYKGKEYRFKSPSNVWRFPCVDDKSGDRTGHPTQKPVELIERIVRASSPEGGVVLDCFMGSGTTGVAAMRNRRRFIGMEINPEYLSIAQSRFDATEVPE